tara:strand:- start:115 stop:330 length:216 start_codon:yes stop_codon:yes gene_type:complete
MSKFSKKFCGKSPFKHYKEKDGKVLNTHSHTSTSGEKSYHSQSRQTGKTRSYRETSKGLVKSSRDTGKMGF